ncbi:MAG: universal stress protein [Actinomycetota bacterium]|nr:universal stress protein [Actinomycetota bacterium]
MANDFPSKILTATDASEDALLATQAAINLSSRTGAELHLVHAWQNLRPPALPAMAIDEYSQAYEQWKRGAGELLDEQAERLRNAGGTVAGAHLRKGHPAEETTKLAEELNVGFVIIGSRGLGAMKRLVMGSVSEGVVHLATRPTLVVRGGERAWPPSKLIVGDDASEEARRAGELAMGIGKLFDAQALLVRVYPQVTVFKARRIVHTRASKQLLKEGKRSLEKRAAELESVLGMRPEIRVTSGDTAAIIQEAAGEGPEPTLVAVGRRGLGAVRHLALGSVSSGVLRAVSGPVLIVPPPIQE